MPQTHPQHLTDLLVSIFRDSGQLRRTLYALGPKLVAELPADRVPLAESAHTASHEVLRRGLTPALRNTLLDFAPQRRKDIERVCLSANELAVADAQRAGDTDRVLRLKRDARDGTPLTRRMTVGSFTLRRKLGSGGYAEAWLADDKRNNRKATIKILHHQYSDDKTRRERFFRGARQMAKLDHPNIVKVIDLGGESMGRYYYALEFIEGEDLGKAIQRGLLPQAILDIAEQAANAISYAHGRGILHRDIKPDNILLDRNGRVYLTDFDLVWAKDTTGGTRSGLGTYLFAAPEQEENAKDVTAACDVYSLGMTLICCFLGVKKPLKKDVLQQIRLRKKLNERCEWARDVLLCAISVEEGDRYESILDFTRALAQAHSRRGGTVVRTAKPWLPPQIDGQVFSGRYRIGEIFRSRHIGIVYQAEHIEIQKQVLIKVLQPRYANDPSIARQFLSEARTISRLHQTNIANVMDSGRTQDGYAYFVLDCRDGESLEDTALKDGPLPWRRVIRIAKQLCKAVIEIHESGMIHRDVRPANCYRVIRNDNHDFIKIVDFGCIVSTDVLVAPNPPSLRGLTSAYSAPEILRGQPYDHTVDIFSLGVLMYRLLTGKRPERTHLGTRWRLDFDLDIPESLETIVIHAMAHDPKLRFFEARELLGALERAETELTSTCLAKDPLAWCGQGGGASTLVRSSARVSKQTRTSSVATIDHNSSRPSNVIVMPLDTVRVSGERKLLSPMTTFAVSAIVFILLGVLGNFWSTNQGGPADAGTSNSPNNTAVAPPSASTTKRPRITESDPSDHSEYAVETTGSSAEAGSSNGTTTGSERMQDDDSPTANAKTEGSAENSRYESPPPRARKLFEEAHELLNEGRFDSAAQLFRKSLLVLNDPKMYLFGRSVVLSELEKAQKGAYNSDHDPVHLCELNDTLTAYTRDLIDRFPSNAEELPELTLAREYQHELVRVLTEHAISSPDYESAADICLRGVQEKRSR